MVTVCAATKYCGVLAKSSDWFTGLILKLIPCVSISDMYPFLELESSVHNCPIVKVDK